MSQMKHQLNKSLFEESIMKKIPMLMDNNVVEAVPRQEVVDFFRSLRDGGVEAKWQQIMLI